MADTSITFNDYSIHKNMSVQNTVVTAQATEGNILGWIINNPNTADVYVKVFDATSSGVVSLGTTVPGMMPLLIPAMTEIVFENTGHSQFHFNNGLHYCVVTGIADTNTTNPTNPIQVQFYLT